MRQISAIRTWALCAACVAMLASCGADSPKSLVKSAKDYLAAGDKNAAVIQLRSALQKSPDDPEARYLLGTILVERRDPASAIRELRRALQLGYPPEQVMPALARAMIDEGDAKDLIAEFGETKLASPDEQAAFKTTIGNALMTLGKPKEAEAAFNDALAARADFAGALLGLATLRVANGDIEGGKKIVDDVLTRPQAPPEASLLKARFLVADNQRDAAISILTKAAEAKPDYLPVRYELVSMLIAKGDLDLASSQVGAIRNVSKQDSRAYFFDALIASQRGNLPAAREAIQQVLKASPNHVPSLLLAGEIEYRAKQFNQAEDYLRRALKGAPGVSYAQRLLAATYLRLGSPARAVEVLQQPLARGLKDPQLMAVAGEAYLAVGDYPRAAQYFAQTAAMDPKNVAARTRLGQVRLAEGDTEGAIRDLEAASALDPNVSAADLALVTNLLRQKQFDQALGVVARLEKKQPSNPLVYNLKGIVYLTKRDLANARANFERALQIQSDYLPAIGNLAQLDRMEKKPDTGRKRYEAILEKEPNNEQALLALAGLVQSRGGDPGEVEALLKKAVAANAQSMSARVALATLYMRKGDTKQALTVAQEANAALPNDPHALELLGQMQLASGDALLAVGTFNKLVAARPGAVEPLVRLAAALVLAKDYDKAIEKLREALTINPEFFEANKDIVVVYAKAGRTDQALLEVKAIQRRLPTDARGYVLEGDLWVSQQKWREAEAAYRAAQKYAPDEGTVAAKLFAASTEAGNGALADAAADKWLRAHPKDALLHSYIGDRAMRRHDYKAAARHYQAVVGLQPDNAIFLNNLAWASGELGDPKALSYAEKAATIAPTNPAILDTLGSLLVKKGDVSQGLEKLRQAVQLAPNAAAIRLHFAKALIKAGDKPAARKELELLAQAGSGTNADAAADPKSKSVQQKSPGKGLTCGPDCAAEVAALMKTL